jgi:transcriptional regulator with XRE-family HTH domain
MTGNELRAARLRMYLTQADLASLLDVSRPTVSYYETGHAKVPRTVELAIEALMRRQKNDLVAGAKAEHQDA